VSSSSSSYQPHTKIAVCDNCNKVWPWDRLTCPEWFGGCGNEKLRYEGKIEGEWGERQFNVKIDWLGNPDTANIRCEYCESPLEPDNGTSSKYGGWASDEREWERRNAYFSKYGFKG
jgi:hypothetical protein